MNKFINKEMSFLPEIYKDGYLIGHTGNYLQIKTMGNSKLLNKLVNVLLIKIEYPYVIAQIS
jgi:hypothetical protein